MAEMIYRDATVRVDHDADAARFVVRYGSGRAVEVPESCRLVEVAGNAAEACRRAGVDPATRLVADGSTAILPRESRSSWELAIRLAEAARSRAAAEDFAALDPELRSALSRFPSAASAYRVEAMREYHVLHRAGY